ncbi:MAG: restriction endonuclease subunit S [Flavobacteriales bacterium]|nr:restriction endonuclease subunit S [Flavobacteriales bacterium]
MKSYDNYKTINIDWLDKLPSQWKTIQIKQLKNGDNTVFIDGDWIESHVITEGGIRYLTTGNIGAGYYKEQGVGFINEETFEKLNCTEVFPGDLLISRLNEPIGRACIIPDLGYRIITAVDNVILRPKKPFNVRYLMHLMNSPEYSAYTSLISRGATMKRISRGLLGGIKIPFPSGEEQIKIADFLDYKTNLVDLTIEKKKKLIDLLKEKRQAVINEALTKGLNPNAPMKDSGLKWLGEIPEHWNVRNFDSTAMKNQYSFTGGPFGSDLKSDEYTDTGVRIIQLQNIGVGIFKDDYKIYTSDEKAVQLESCLIFPGDIIIAKMADPVARACIIPNFEEKYIMASDGIRLEVDKHFFNTKFIEYSVNSIYFNSQAEAVSTGTTRLRIGLTVLKKLKILAPPIEEQNLIVEELMIQELKINSIVSKLDKQIQKLQFYRQSIISEAVTGKIDVRDWQPNLNT